MFIPLEELHNWLNQQVDDNTLIYYFWPPGTKKISNIFHINQPQTVKLENQIPMLLHDQEPLNFDMYQNHDDTEIETWIHNWDQNIKPRLDYYGLSKLYIDLLKDKNLNLFYGAVYADKWMLCHSEKSSDELRKYEQIGAVGIYWWSHYIISRDWYRFACQDRRLDFNGEFTHDFNIYNRAWTGTREYRLKFAELILENQLDNCSQIRFSKFDNGNNFQDHIYTNPKFKISRDLSILPENQSSATDSANYSSDDYQDCAIDVVLETLFDDSRIHLTEKILRPIACGKPFILVSTPGALQYLKDYGFLTFSPLIDESYDQINDPIDRLNAIIASMKKINDLSPTDKKRVYHELHAISRKNRDRFWSDDLYRLIVDEWRTNYRQAVDVCLENMTGLAKQKVSQIFYMKKA